MAVATRKPYGISSGGFRYTDRNREFRAKAAGTNRQYISMADKLLEEESQPFEYRWGQRQSPENSLTGDGASQGL